MLATVVFIAFWVLLALALFYVAIRGGLASALQSSQTQSRSGRRVIAVFFVFLYVGFGVVIPYAFLRGNKANASSHVGGIKLTPDEKEGRYLFGQNCAACHTLSAANAVGKVGPNLDSLKPPVGLVLNTINYGCVQSPPQGSPQACLGQGTMPAQLVEGKQAQQVAKFVAKVAGNE